MYSKKILSGRLLSTEIDRKRFIECILKLQSSLQACLGIILINILICIGGTYLIQGIFCLQYRCKKSFPLESALYISYNSIRSVFFISEFIFVFFKQALTRDSLFKQCTEYSERKNTHS